VSEGLDIWRERLEYFQRNEAVTADPEQKFALHKKIEEAKAKIAELEAAAAHPIAPSSAGKPPRERHDLVIFIQARRDHWQHQFFLPTQPDAIKPKLDCPKPTMVLGYDLDGEMLFQLLFGSDPTIVSQLLALAFGTRAFKVKGCSGKSEEFFCWSGVG